MGGRFLVGVAGGKEGRLGSGMKGREDGRDIACVSMRSTVKIQHSQKHLPSTSIQALISVTSRPFVFFPSTTAFKSLTIHQKGSFFDAIKIR